MFLEMMHWRAGGLSCVQTGHLCVLVHIWTKDEVGAVKIFLLTVQMLYFFVDHLSVCALCFSCFHVCSLLPCGHLLGKG